MLKFLILYLAVTGIAACAALLMPGLVVIGMFLLILPGLFLAMAPTAFLWGALFTIVWLPARMLLGDAGGGVAAAAATAAILVAIPWPSHIAGLRRLEASILPDIVPAAPIQPAGDIRLDLRSPERDRKLGGPGKSRIYRCNDLCLTLLFTPGVTSVTVNSSAGFTPDEHRRGTGGLDPGARTYRLIPKGECGDRAVELERPSGLFGSPDERQATAAAWNLKLATEYCIVADPPLDRFDLVIVEGGYQYPDPDHSVRLDPWSLKSVPAQVDYAEIRDGTGEPVLRRLVSRVDVLDMPFHVRPSGGIENFRFGWGRRRLNNAGLYASVSLVETLETHNILSAAALPDDLQPRISERLQRAVADPAPTAADPAFATMGAYLAGLAGAPLSDEDVALVRTLVLDGRLVEYHDLYRLEDIPPAQYREIGKAVVGRLLAEPDVKVLRASGLSAFLEASPEGSFAVLSEDERRLLAHPERRMQAGGLIARLSDHGPGAIPRLIEILRHHGTAMGVIIDSRERSSTERSDLYKAHRLTVESARIGLCRLGPAASAALPEIEAMIEAGTIPGRAFAGSERNAWNLTLLRLGKPLDSIPKPDNMSGTEAAYRSQLQYKIDRFDPKRSCR